MSVSGKVLTGLFRTFLVMVIIGAALALSIRMIRSRPQAQREPRPPAIPMVQVFEARRGEARADIEAMGTVIPSRSLVVQPEVTGRVIRHHPSLVVGGTIAEGEEILLVDRRDYEAVLSQQLALVEKAEAELRIEKGRKAVAEQEWELFQSDITSTDLGRDLALREPQLRKAEADLKAAREGLEKARLNLERSSIPAPFNSIVLEESVEIGQLVSPQSRLATLAGTDEFWVQVAVPVTRVGDIELPSPDGIGGSRVRISFEGEGETVFKGEGRVKRLLGELDPVGRMARLIVAVPDPLEAAGNGNVPILLGSYVRVVIDGRRYPDVFILPRAALREGGAVWILAGGKLEVRTVEVLWRTKETVCVGNGLSDGDLVITSSLLAPLPGMTLRAAGSR